MKLLIIVFLCLPLKMSAQSYQLNFLHSGQFYNAVKNQSQQVFPDFKSYGDDFKLLDYCKLNLEVGINVNELSHVYISFTVDKQGKLIQSGTYGFFDQDEELLVALIKIMRSVYHWIPDKKDGKLVEGKYFIVAEFIANKSLNTNVTTN